MSGNSLPRFAHELFTKECEFVAGAATADSLPTFRLPELAFIGRSNVGKSSLINALTGRKALARVSLTPGRTQQLNFFKLGGKLMLVDLPGYGYAKASKGKVKLWNKLIHHYLIGRANLARVLVLIDSRRGLMDIDIDMMRLLDDAAVSYQIVLTKMDELNREEQAKVLADTHEKAARHPAAYPEVLFTSAQKGYGIEDMRTSLASFAAGAPKKKEKPNENTRT